MASYLRFKARNEPFGISIYDRYRGQLHVLRGIEDISQSRVILRDGDKTISVTPEEIDFVPTVVKRKDILVGPTYAEIYPTLACDERCLFCYMGDVLVKTMPGMPKSIVDATAKQLSDVGTFQASILGGEPFLWKNLTYLMTALDDAGINVSVSTNGTILNKDLFIKLTEMNVKLNFSFHSHIPEVHDAITQKHGAAKLAIRTLDFLQTIGHPPHISIVINSMNIGGLVDTIEFVCKKGVTAISIYHAMKSGFSESSAGNIGIPFADYVNVFSQAKKVGEKYGAVVRVVTNFPFLADPELIFDRNLGDLANLLYGTIDGRRAVYVNYDGKVYSTSYRFGKEDFAMGDIVTHDLSDMWNNSPAIEQFRRAKPPLQCNGCPHFDICRGGPVSNYPPTFLRKSQTDPISCPLHEVSISE